MTDNGAAPYVLYTLHFEQPVSGKRHYTGITHHKNLEARLQQHVRGSGANLTRRAALQGVKIWLVNLRPATEWAEERTLKRNRHAERRCPLCNPSRPFQGDGPRLIVSTLPDVPKPQSVLSWSTAAPRKE